MIIIIIIISIFPLCRVSILMFMRQTMSLGNNVLQLFWCYYLWCSYRYLKSSLSIENKLLFYKVIIKPIWTYGIEMWGCCSKSNVNIIQRFQSKTLRMLAGAPWYVSNQTLHTDRIPYSNGRRRTLKKSK
jgi:hypothetical protein